MCKPYKIFEALSESTWRWLNYSNRRGIRIGEDAITSYNLSIIDTLCSSAVVVEDTRNQEHEKGADWEFWIGSNRTGWYRYAIQAKKLTIQKNRYQSLGHTVKGKPQIDILESYAKEKKAEPIYCLYNFVSCDITEYWHCPLPVQAAQLGCSIAPLSVVRNALQTRGGRNFSFIHSDKKVLPWRCLLKCPIRRSVPFKPQAKGLQAVMASNFYEKLPNAISTLVEKREQWIFSEFRSFFQTETLFRPHWFVVIEDETDG